MTAMASVKELLAIAVKQIGITEWPKNSNKVKYNTWYYGREVSGSDYPWCMAFVQWCYNEAQMKLPYKTASCSALLNWYREHHPECVVSKPEPGDVVIYDFGHTGIVESAAVGKITAIEGNTSAGSSGSQDNGGGVYRRTRSTSCVRAFIRPITAMQPVKTEEDEDMTHDKFYMMFKAAMKEYRDELRDNDSGAWSENARKWAIENGLFAGNGNAPDGTPNFMWEDLLTREQVAQLFYRFAQQMGKA